MRILGQVLSQHQRAVTVAFLLDPDYGDGTGYGNGAGDGRGNAWGADNGDGWVGVYAYRRNGDGGDRVYYGAKWERREG